MNVVLVSHCDFAGNSAFHVLAVARELHGRGFSPVICVPANKETLDEVASPPFPVLTYDEALTGSLSFPDGEGPGLIHAFTPREHVRSLTESLCLAHGCPHVVHLEDNESVLLADDLALWVGEGAPPPPVAVLDTLALTGGRAHPVRAARFVSRAAGMTAVIEPLLELKPRHVPGAVFWPGFDADVLDSRPREALRNELGLAPSDLVVAYTGNIHNSNLGEVRSLYIAVGLLRRAGLPVRLVKTGWNHVDMTWASECVGDGDVLDLGFVSRERLWDLLAAADVFVQPGGPSPFNDYRFPSKLPDFLATGKPVVLPATNIGRHLADGEDALLLRRGDAAEIFEAVRRLAGDAGLRARLGENGRRFALANLRWEQNVESIVGLYGQIAHGTSPLAVADRSPDAQVAPPVELVSFYDLRDPELVDRQAALARSYGIYGLCFSYSWSDGGRVQAIDELLARGTPDLPFCLCWANEEMARQDFAAGWEERFIRHVLPALADARAITVDGAPLLLVYRADAVPDVERAVERWREIAAQEAGLELHVAAVQSFGIGDPRPYGLDAAVELPPHTEDYPAAIQQRLAMELPEHRWYRSVPVGSSPAYETWLTKIVLQTLCRSSVDEPLVFLDAGSGWAEGTLEATRTALHEGVRRYYASRGFELGADQVALHLRDVLPSA